MMRFTIAETSALDVVYMKDSHLTNQQSVVLERD